jgi:hypothetical protein
MMHLIQVKNASKIVKTALISACGHWLGDSILYPLDTISTRLKASKHENHNPFIFSYHTIKK